MIALCAEHHAKADAGAYTKDQVREMKTRGRKNAYEVRGRFDWMRRDLLAVVGGNFYYQTPVVVQYGDEKGIWFNRDDEGYLLLNVRMRTISGHPRVRIEDSFWLSRGEPADLVCPPHGRLLDVRYDNGDSLRVEFFDVVSVDDANGRYPGAASENWGISFPVTTVEVRERVGGTSISFDAKRTSFGGVQMMNCFTSEIEVALHIS